MATSKKPVTTGTVPMCSVPFIKMTPAVMAAIAAEYKSDEIDYSSIHIDTSEEKPQLKYYKGGKLLNLPAYQIVGYVAYPSGFHPAGNYIGNTHVHSMFQASVVQKSTQFLGIEPAPLPCNRVYWSLREAIGRLLAQEVAAGKYKALAVKNSIFGMTNVDEINEMFANVNHPLFTGLTAQMSHYIFGREFFHDDQVNKKDKMNDVQKKNMQMGLDLLGKFASEADPSGEFREFMQTYELEAGEQPVRYNPLVCFNAAGNMIEDPWNATAGALVVVTVQGPNKLTKPLAKGSKSDKIGVISNLQSSSITILSNGNGENVRKNNNQPSNKLQRLLWQAAINTETSTVQPFTDDEMANVPMPDVDDAETQPCNEQNNTEVGQKRQACEEESPKPPKIGRFTVVEEEEEDDDVVV